MTSIDSQGLYRNTVSIIWPTACLSSCSGQDGNL